MRHLLWIIIVSSNLLAANDLNEYSIPVTPGLEPWATFVIKDAHLRVRKGRANLEYHMPTELAGESPLKLEANGVFHDFASPIELSGKFIKSAKCDLFGGLARCQIVYRNELPTLTEEGKKAVEDYLRKTINDVTELENRLEVLEEFVSGPSASIADGHEAGGKFERLRVRYR